MTAHTLQARPRAERPPLRQTLLALLISLAATGVAWLVAVYSAPDSVRLPLAWGAGTGGLALCAAVALAVHGRAETRRLSTVLTERDRRAAHFADVTAPALVRHLRVGASADTALAAIEQPADAPEARVLRLLAEEVGRSEAGKAAALAACANAAGRMQALAISMLADLREMEHRHGDEDVLGDLLLLDHRTAQAGRLADSLAVLTGARSGRRWAKPIVMESILRGAMGRIGAYQRVRPHSTVNTAVAGHAAEGVMHALAELLDNAANFSPPTAEVHVYVEEVQAGVVITVEDSGLVMSDIALRRAEQAVSGENLDPAALSGTRLGLAVVGRLARKHGLKVSFRPSARGGTGVLLMIPQQLITRPKEADWLPAAATPPSQTQPQSQPLSQPQNQGRPPATPVAPALPDPFEGPVATEEHAPADSSSTGTNELPTFGDSGLPKRRRGRTLANALRQERSRQREPQETTRANGHSPAESAARFGAFRQALRGQAPDPADTSRNATSHPEEEAP
ncbi:ATP-binding protein [Streptomyces sp. NBRC 109706]|uniref:ATP-binding protein n=1 Tax=Streptomyces sp. NBRC 109706 TaxID=1550035 RepID=UPI0007866096|nr:ATP-binding protein [Streptomyces sp. NBRC 109706]